MFMKNMLCVVSLPAFPILTHEDGKFFCISIKRSPLIERRSEDVLCACDFGNELNFETHSKSFCQSFQDAERRVSLRTVLEMAGIDFSARVFV